MNIKNIKILHIIGIGGCASSAIAEFLTINGLKVSGSEMKKKPGLAYLEKSGVKIFYSHDKNNLYGFSSKPDMVLFSPAVMSLNPSNPEILEAKNNRIPLISWQEFIGNYLNSIGKTGITVSGSEGKGTTAGVLTFILKNTEWDPLSILGAKMKSINNNEDSNIYLGKGKSYILEADEFNRNFHNYHPSINIMINFQYEHPETYENWYKYQEAFFEYFNGMQGDKVLIFKASKNLADFVKKFNLTQTHRITWFDDDESKGIINNPEFSISGYNVSPGGIKFTLKNNDKNIDFDLPILPGYMRYNTAGAIIAALYLGLPVHVIQKNIKNFKGMVRRFDAINTRGGGAVITDYGHSPAAINNILNETREIYKNKIIHLIFQPHLFSRTYNFFNEFVNELKYADRLSIIDIYPARENPGDWNDKINSQMLYKAVKQYVTDTFYAGASNKIQENITNRLDNREITIFLGAGDMDLYYNNIINQLIK